VASLWRWRYIVSTQTSPLVLQSYPKRQQMPELTSLSGREPGCCHSPNTDLESLMGEHSEKLCEKRVNDNVVLVSRRVVRTHSSVAGETPEFASFVVTNPLKSAKIGRWD
jgi:hypothetical protein